MKLVNTAVLLVLAVCLGAVGGVQAGPFFLQAHGGLSLVNLDDINDSIDAFNEQAGSPVLDHISRGLDIGLHVGYSLDEELALGLGYARLNGESGFARDGYLIRYDMPADLFEVFLDYLPADERRVRVGAGADMGLVSSAATLHLTVPDLGDQEVAFKGVGFLFAGYGIAEASLNPAWSLFGKAGFRHAIIGELKVDGRTVLNPDSSDDKLRFNYSGFFLRLGIRFRP